MRASLVSREVIADSIELMTHAHDFDALVCLVGCDKTVPAALMALARLDKPAVVLYSGPMRAGPRQRHDPGRLGGGRRRGARADQPRDELDALELVACPGAGTCAGHFTANTMAVALECLGIAVAGDGLVSAVDLETKAAAARRAGALAAGPLPSARTFLDRRALLNAMAGIAATGGSTNGVLHLLAIAREAGVELTLDDLAGRRGAHAGDREPRTVGPLRRRRLPRRRRDAHADPRARGGAADRRRRADGHWRTLAAETADAPEPDGEIVFTVERPFKTTAALAVLRGNLAPDGSLVKAAGAGPKQPPRPGARLRQRRGVRRRGSRAGASRPATCSSSATKARPAGPGMREMLSVTVVRRRRRARRDRRARNRRTLLRRDARADGRPRRARGRARRPARRRARRRHDLDRRRRAAHFDIELDDASSRAARIVDAAGAARTRQECSAATARSSARRPKAPSCGTASPEARTRPRRRRTRGRRRGRS